MRRWNSYWLIAAFFLSLSPQAFAQITPGPIYPNGSAGLSFVAALPALCTPGVTPSVQLTVAPYTINYCSATNTWTAVGAGGAVSSVFTRTGAVSALSTDYGSNFPGVFTISSACSVVFTNCLQWVDDDSTDNCGTATTNFMALINGYTGKGVPQVVIGGSGGTGLAYKLTACNLIFSNARGVDITLTATIDCAMALQSCIQLNATSTSGAAVAYPTVLQVFRLHGGGGLIGGTALTGTGGNGSATAAGVYVMPQTAVAYVEDIFLGGSGTNAGFGATSAMGSCGVWSVYIDFPISGAWVSHVSDDVNSTSTTAGGCGLGNPKGATLGSNTVFFTNNFVYTQGEVGGTGQCGSIGIADGGSLGGTLHNNIFGMAIPIQLLGVGHRSSKNQLDSTQCTAGGVSAVIQVGGTTAVGPTQIEGNEVQLGTSGGHAADFIAKQSGATATLTGWTITGNMNNLSTAGLMFPNSSLPCTPIAGSVDFCSIRDNQFITEPTICGASAVNYQGWAVNSIVANCFPAAASANITASALYTPAFGIGTTAFCQVILTQAATTSSTLPQCEVTYTDLWSNTSQTVILTPVWASGTVGCAGSTTNTVGNSCQGSTMISPKAATAVTFSTINYASSGATVMQYQAFVQASAH